MSNSYQIFALSALLAMGSLSASEGEIAFLNRPKKTADTEQTCPNPIDPNITPTLYLQPCPDPWRLSVDFVYFLPTVDDTYFVINSPIVGTFTLLGTRSNNDFGFSPGFRVGAEYDFCETRRDIQLFYTYLHAEQNRNVSGDNMWGTQGSSQFAVVFEDYVGTASSKLKLLYQRLDFNLSQHVLETKGFNLYIQPGLEYAYFRLQQNYGYDNFAVMSGTSYQQSRGWGLGPQIGLGFDSSLYTGYFRSSCKVTHAVAMSGLFSSSILTGQGQTQELDIRGGDTTENIQDQQAWRTIPALHARAGLTYLIHGTSMGASLYIGYEFNTYIRGLAKMLFPNSTVRSNITTSYYNFDIQGLDMSLAFTF